MKNLGILMFLMVVPAMTVIAQPDVCRLAYHYWNKEAKSGSSRHLIGEFRPKADDDTTLNKFRHDETGKDIFVGVTIIQSSIKGTRKKIRVALSFELKVDDLFDEPTRVEAETVLDKNWKWLKVAKLQKVDSREYTFEFACERK